jgi:hypothetical protein
VQNLGLSVTTCEPFLLWLSFLLVLLFFQFFRFVFTFIPVERLWVMINRKDMHTNSPYLIER